MSFVVLRTVKCQVLTLVLCAASWSQPAGAQSGGPEQLAEAFVRAWNAHDAKAFGNMFAEDADWVPVSGARVKGRSQIELLLGKEHSTWARTTSLKAADIQVRPIARDLALVFFTWRIGSTKGPDDQTAAAFRGNTLLVASRQANRWIAIAGQAAITP